MNAFTHARLRSSLAQLAIRTSQNIYAELHAAYSQPHRHYHDSRHIGHCLTQFDIHRAFAVHPVEIEIALWFHDAIYDTRRNDNERRSADWAKDFLEHERANRHSIERIHALIIASQHSSLVSDPDQQLLADIDLGVLGQPADVFERYDSDIRREYHWVPWPQYVEGRVSVLGGFLERARIYSTAAFVDRYEAQARLNIANAIEKLEHDPDRGSSHV